MTPRRPVGTGQGEHDAFEDLDSAALEAEGAGTATDRSESSDLATDGTGEEEDDVSDSATRISYQDTVDLTPLPGFDTPSPAGSAPETDEHEEPAEQKPAKKSRPRSKRASMPSWDEIVFGSKHD